MNIVDNPQQLFTQLQIQDFVDYITVMEESIESHKDLLVENYHERTKGFNEQQAQELYEAEYFDRYVNLDHTYSFILRKSLFITLYSFLETELKRIAKSIESKKLTNIKINDVRYKGIQGYLFFIEEVNNIHLELHPETRALLKSYNKLRNRFVHDEDDELTEGQYENLKNVDGIMYSHFNYPEHKPMHFIESLDSCFNDNYIQLISNVLDELYHSLTINNINLSFS